MVFSTRVGPIFLALPIISHLQLCSEHFGYCCGVLGYLEHSGDVGVFSGFFGHGAQVEQPDLPPVWWWLHCQCRLQTLCSAVLLFPRSTRLQVLSWFWEVVYVSVQFSGPSFTPVL